MKKKAKSKTKDLELSYKFRPILEASAIEFEFQEKLTMLAIHVPTVGVFVVGKGGPSPSPCWKYPEKMSFKDAVSKTFRRILEEGWQSAKEKKTCCP